MFKRGISLIELLIVIGILSMVVSMVIYSFSRVGGSEALDTTVMSVVAVLNEAKSQSVSSKNQSAYGVRIFNNKLVSFRNTYGTENKETTISNLVTISTSTGIGTDIIFNNVTGNTSASGTITIKVLSDLTKQSTIRVYNTGVVEKN